MWHTGQMHIYRQLVRMLVDDGPYHLRITNDLNHSVELGRLHKTGAFVEKDILNLNCV